MIVKRILQIMISLTIVLSLVFVVGNFGVNLTGATITDFDDVFTGFGVLITALIIGTLSILLVDFAFFRKKHKKSL